MAIRLYGGAEEELYAAQGDLDRNISRKYAEYQVEIEGLYEEYIEPIKEKRDEEIETIRERDSNDVDSWQNVCESISSQIRAIEAPYDEQLSKPETDYQKSRNLYAESHFRWLKDNIQRYIELAPETEALCFGLMKGCLMEALKEGEKVRDLIHRAVYWDTKQAYNYMGEDIDGDEVIQVEIWDTLEKLYEEANL